MLWNRGTMEAAEYKEKWLEKMQELRKGTAMEALNIEVLDVDEDGIELVMPINDAVRQQMGMLHGGMSMLLAESAARMHSTWGIDTNEVMPVGIEINGSHVRSESDGNVRAAGKVIRRSAALIVHQVDIIHETSNKLLSTARATNYYKMVQKRDTTDPRMNNLNK